MGYSNQERQKGKYNGAGFGVQGHPKTKGVLGVPSGASGWQPQLGLRSSSPCVLPHLTSVTGGDCPTSLFFPALRSSGSIGRRRPEFPHWRKPFPDQEEGVALTACLCLRQVGCSRLRIPTYKAEFFRLINGGDMNLHPL